jgi:hypothetical protein
MLVCVECGRSFEDGELSVDYFICDNCIIEIE